LHPNKDAAFLFLINQYMTITYLIKTPRRAVKFTEATLMDAYLKKNKFSVKSVIVLVDENKKEIGTLSVSEYLNFEKKQK
jgi:hypothetical protein